jgi:triphosphatase
MNHKPLAELLAEDELGPAESFYFRGRDGSHDLQARNLTGFLWAAGHVDDDTWRYHLERGDYAAWFRHTLRDADLADAAEALRVRPDLDAAQSRACIRAAVEQRYAAPPSRTADREIELKLELARADAPELRRYLGAIGAAESPAKLLASAYFDTPGFGLQKHHLTLRIRMIDERRIQTVKAAAGSGIFDRAEWEAEVRGDEPDLEAMAKTPVGFFLAETQKRHGLVRVFETQVERTTWRLTTGRSEIEIALDDGKVTAAGAEAPIYEVELELKTGSATDLFAVARGLAEVIPAKLGVLAKSDRGYALARRAAAGPSKAAPVALDREMSSTVGFQAITRACLRQFRLNEPLAIGERSAESVHQARVAIRRLRSALSLFKEILDDGELDTIKTQLRDLSQQLGRARNLDVSMQRVAHVEAEHELLEPGFGALAAELARERTEAYDRMAATLGGKPFARDMLDLLAWIEIGAWLRPADPERRKRLAAPLVDMMTAILDRRWRRMKKWGRHFGTLAPEARHEIRIEAKKLRYASEFFTGLVSGKTDRRRHRRILKALERLQAHLGSLNDIRTWHELAMGLAAKQGTIPAGACQAAAGQGAAGQAPAAAPDHVFAAGYISGRLDAESAKLLSAAASAHRDLMHIKPFWS